jgi:hypothetical protein
MPSLLAVVELSLPSKFLKISYEINQMLTGSTPLFYTRQTPLMMGQP